MLPMEKTLFVPGGMRPRSQMYRDALSKLSKGQEKILAQAVWDVRLLQEAAQDHNKITSYIAKAAIVYERLEHKRELMPREIATDLVKEMLGMDDADDWEIYLIQEWE